MSSRDVSAVYFKFQVTTSIVHLCYSSVNAVQSIHPWCNAIQHKKQSVKYRSYEKHSGEVQPGVTTSKCLELSYCILVFFLLKLKSHIIITIVPLKK
jgi:hypothetical protein